MKKEDGNTHVHLRRFGLKQLMTEDAGDLAGAVSDAVVTISYTGERILLESNHDETGFSSRVWVESGDDGKLVLNTRAINASGSPSGTGLRVIASQVEAARAVGIDRIELTAAGSGPRLARWEKRIATLKQDGIPKSEWPEQPGNGFYSWARYGFNDTIVMIDSVDYVLSDLMNSEQGRKLWRQQGADVDLSFVVSTESTNSKRLESYVKERTADT